MSRTLHPRILASLPFIVPLGVVALARLLTFTPLAADNSSVAAALYAWIVADALLLGLLAKSHDHRPTFFQVAGIVSAAIVVIVLGASPPLRAVYFGLPELMVAAGGTVCVFIAWTGYRVVSQWRERGSFVSGLETVLPAGLVKAIVSECEVIRLGLFRWRTPVEVTAGHRAYSYHTYLTPMIATFLALQVIELSVVHFLLMLWNPTVAWIMFAMSVWGLIWTTALLKSFRIKPVLVGPDTIRVRSGMIHDFEIAIERISVETTSFTSEELADSSILNLAILSSPNVSLRFTKPLAIPTFFGQTREIAGVGLRLDDSDGFLKELARLR